MGGSRHEKRKEARLQKNQKKHESWLQRQKSQKENRVSSSVQNTGDVIKSEDFHQISDSETEHMELSSPSGNKDDGKPFIHNKEEVRVKAKEKKMQKLQRMKDLNRPKKKTKFEEFLEMDTPAVISADQDAELERRLAKKLKVKKGKLRGLDDGMNDLFDGLPSVLDSMGSELGDSRKKRKKKRSEENQNNEVVDDMQETEVLEHEETDFLDEESEEEPPRKRDRKQLKKKKKKSIDEELDSDPLEITDDGESETITPSSLENVEPQLHEYKPESSSKYVAPHLRSQAKSESEEHTKMRTRIKGLLNKMAESNVETITAELATIYRTVARSVSSQIFCEEVLTTYARGNEQYSVFASFIAGMACLVGMDFSAKLIASLAKSFEDEYQKEDSLSLNGISLLLSYLCMLGVCSSDLIFDFLMTLGKRLTKVDASIITTVLDCCGMKIRSDDPLAMKKFIISIQNKANEIKTSLEGQTQMKSMMMEKMLETISAIKNNKLRTKEDSVQNTRVKKWLQKLRVEEVLLRGLTWSKLLDPEKKGQWWLSGDLVVKTNSVEDVAETMDAEVVEAQKMLKLAEAQRMNTDSRKAIFCVIMSSEDYIDAFEKLLRLDLPGKQDREIMRVLVECCLQEKVFNKYYTVLASKLCEHDKNHKFTLQYCIWDHFKELESMSLQRSMHLAKFVTEIIVSFNLSLAVLKSVDLANPAELTPKRIMHFRMLFEAIFEHPENLVWNLFTRIALNPDYEGLRDGIKFFVKEYVVKNNKAINGKFRKAKEALNNAEGLLM
ncbi:nucleolar MIF4G domain-containing protein 1 [Capsella rubella]|nr:nucleolar MIF4G domain-containing protein 1 [Capsella rubella]